MEEDIRRKIEGRRREKRKKEEVGRKEEKGEGAGMLK